VDTPEGRNDRVLEEYQPASIRLRRLAAETGPSAALPTFDELGLSRLLTECVAWQRYRAGGWFWELNAMSGGRYDCWREIPLLMGSVAESALLACSAEVEIECLRRAMKKGDLPIQFGLSLRFYAEGQGHQLLGAGHRLANIAVRTLMLAKDYPWGKVAPGIADPFPPYSESREHWISLSRIDKVEQVAAASPHATLKRLVAVVVALAKSTDWQALEELRGKYCHRSRDEGPFVIGARQHMVWATDETTHTRKIEFGGEVAPSTTEVWQWLDRVCSIHRRALQTLPTTLASFRQNLDTAMTELTDGNFTIAYEE
jgi:hypothetical protein